MHLERVGGAPFKQPRRNEWALWQVFPCWRFEGCFHCTRSSSGKVHLTQRSSFWPPPEFLRTAARAAAGAAAGAAGVEATGVTGGRAIDKNVGTRAEVLSASVCSKGKLEMGLPIWPSFSGPAWQGGTSFCCCFQCARLNGTRGRCHERCQVHLTHSKC